MFHFIFRLEAFILHKEFSLIYFFSIRRIVLSISFYESFHCAIRVYTFKILIKILLKVKNLTAAHISSWFARIVVSFHKHLIVEDSWAGVFFIFIVRIRMQLIFFSWNVIFEMFLISNYSLR